MSETGTPKIKPLKKTKAIMTKECLLLANDWVKRAGSIKALENDKTVTDQQQIKAVKATAKTFETCALELIEVFKDKPAI